MSTQGIDAYTIGCAESYSQGLCQEKTLRKLGRTDNYDGGAVFRSKESAQKFIDDNNYKWYAVFGLTLPNGWETDVDESKEKEEGFCRLLNNAKIVSLK